MIAAILKNLATLGPVGYVPVAPGTFGTLVAAISFLMLKPSPVVHIVLIIFVTIVGIIASKTAEILLNEKDSGHIVIDEFAGYAVSILFVPATASFTVAAFLLFRFFDILKPPPIRLIEKVFPGGVGVVADDLAAGIYANVLLQIWIHLL